MKLNLNIIPKLFVFILTVLLIQSTSYSQFTDFHPELKWYTITGKHCQVHFHGGAERTAMVVAKIADEVIGPLTSLYDYDPGVINYIIKDIDDYSNGATYFFDNRIEIWTSALDFDLRGTHNWLRNVITHETTHMVQIQSGMKFSRTFPALFLQVLNYEDERRPDILYGFPNVMASYPLATVNVPSWFAEGTAQYQRKEFGYDNWDSHRDMILRSYALSNNMLTWNQMGVFDKTSLGNESVYNSGFALTRYISQKYGEDKIEKISHDLGKTGVFTMDHAFEDVLGKDGIEVYNEWKDYLVSDYKKRSSDVLSNLVIGDTITTGGFGNFYPVFSKDGSKFAYVSNKNEDYFSIASVYVYDFKTKKEKIAAARVNSTLSWVPGKNEILYARLDDDNPNWNNVHDVYVYDFDKDKETRLTFDLRANQPSVSQDGSKIVFIFERDGTTNLGTVDFNGKNFKQLTSFKNGEQVYQPKYSPDNSYVLFDYSYADNRSIAKIDTAGNNFQFVIKTNNDDRNAAFDKSGNLIYCSDSSGIFNIYSYNLKTGEKKQLTNAIGGTFMPSIDSSGNILYSGYTSKGFKIFEISPEQQNKVIAGKTYQRLNNPPLDKDQPKGDLAKYDLASYQNYDDYKVPDYKKEPYSGVFSKLTFYPFIRYDNYNSSSNFFEKLKPGMYVSSSDMLDRYAIFAGAAINMREEWDLFLIFNYRNKIPGLFNMGIKPELSIELYDIRRQANTSLGFGPDTVGNSVSYLYTVPVDVNYNLFEIDFAAKQRIFSRGQDLEFRYIFSRYSDDIGSFVYNSDQGATLYPATTDFYFIGSNFQLKYTLDMIKPTIDEDINPIGVRVDLTYNYEVNQFNPNGNYEVKDGTLQPVYNNYNFHRLELNSEIHFPLFDRSTLAAKIRLGNIFGPTEPDFFDFYLGGLVGMKEYPFYAVDGNKVGWFNLTYRFPLFTNIDARLGHVYLDKIFMSFYGDVGNAWNGNFDASGLKKGAGSEIRIQMNSFYLFPTDVFFDAAYGLDKVSRTVNGTTVTYGHEWRFYAGLLFGFDI
ncbi:MAG: biopolymer transporter Tol [Ignavibacteriaceae bacterium]|nr:biopolymer transporter Tol [Ignavibacteriaceae bacterium]